MEKITFIIPCFNQVNHTRKCIETITKYSPRDSFNFVFIDNGSTDNTKQLLKNTPNSHVIRNEENIFVNPAWNQGFKYVLDHDLGDYVCLCNNDIEARPNWLESIFELFKLGRNEWYVPSQDLASESLKLTPINVNFIGFCMFFRKENIKLFYPIPEQLKVLRGDDWISDCLTYHNVFCFKVSHCMVYHNGSTTQNALDLDKIRTNDCNEFSKLYATEYRQKNMKRIFDHKFSIKLL